MPKCLLIVITIILIRTKHSPSIRWKITLAYHLPQIIFQVLWELGRDSCSHDFFNNSLPVCIYTCVFIRMPHTHAHISLSVYRYKNIHKAHTHAHTHSFVPFFIIIMLALLSHSYTPIHTIQTLDTYLQYTYGERERYARIHWLCYLLHCVLQINRV